MDLAKTQTITTGPDGTSKAGKGVGSLARGLKIIQALAEASQPLSLADISALVGFDTSTAHRLLQVLITEGYALKDPNGKRYVASPKSFFPLSLYHTLNLVRRDAEHALISLRDDLGETASIVVFCFGQRMLLELAPGRDPLTPYYGTWLTSPLHGSASGKVLLMSLSKAERQALLGPAPYTAHTPNTITDPEVFERQLQTFAGLGYVVAADDAFVGLTSIAAPIRNGAGAVLGCFALSGGSSNFPEERVQEAGLKLKNAANLFSHGTPSLRPLSNLFGLPTSPAGGGIDSLV